MSTMTRPAPAVKPARKPAAPAHGVARLTLTINGVSYAVKPLDARDFGATRALRLRKSDGVVYDLRRDAHGRHCDCPDFTFRRDGIDPRGCKHVIAAIACGLL